MARRSKTDQTLSFDDQLILFRYFLRELGIDSLSALGKKLNSPEYEGVDESGNTYFYGYIAHIGRMKGARVSADLLRLYDENICRHTRKISEKRGAIRWKYFQYISLLFAEMYLDRYFGDRDAFCKDLNEYLSDKTAETLGLLSFAPYTAEKMNKLAFMCATGSGKTLIMHANILQFMHYFNRAKRLNSRLSLNKIIVLAPNEGMSLQHLDELCLSSIPASLFDKYSRMESKSNRVLIIDMNKLKEEGKVKTVSVDSFEQDNLVLVDEGHRGLSGDVWYDYRTRLAQEGFSFEYSATFKQALNANAKSKQDRELMEEYGKSIIMDYSYKYFYEDGYGKDYRIYNLRNSVDEEHRPLYLTGCLLSFYQQLKLFDTAKDSMAEFHIEKPLLVFVGNRVTAPIKSGKKLSQAEEELLTDVEEVLVFLDRFVRDRKTSVDRIHAVLHDDTGLNDSQERELFFGDFYGLQHIFGSTPDAEAVYRDILRLVFNSDTQAEEPRLHLLNIKQVPGEIALRIGQDGDVFGVISIGDTAGLVKNCDKKGIDAKTEEFISESLFRSINDRDSKIKILIGSRKFTEGWNSWRVSTMGLINFAQGEGSQAIQLFGRGVRLKGYRGCLKRSRKLDDHSISVPRDLEVLETLTIFGVKAQYMEDFKKYLEQEGAPINDDILEFHLPVISRYQEVADKKLRVIKVKDGINFKKQAKRLILAAPDEGDGFHRYLQRSKTVIDCRSKIQAIESAPSLKMSAVSEEHVLPSDRLAYLDYDRIFAELEQYKNEKAYFNISIVKEKLPDILRLDGWYALLIPKNHLEIDSIPKLEAATDYAIMALKSYMDKFFTYEKDRWEAPYLEYTILEERDNNFIEDYTITYARQGETDHSGETLDQFIKEVSTILEKHQGLDEYEKTTFKGNLVLFDFRTHLYAPLLHLEKGSLKIQISPVSLNEDEKKFVSLLKDYVESYPAILEGKSLYLLRNKSKVGMGFFEADNFYPDYILWIDTNETQYISFVDPKGLRQVKSNHPKIEFYKRIKDKEAELQPTSPDKRIVLNSFILSGTPGIVLNDLWDMTKPEREAKNVYTLDDPECVEHVIDKIVQE